MSTRKKQESTIKQISDNIDIVEMNKEVPKTLNKIDKDSKEDFENFKQLYKGLIDEKYSETYTNEDKDLWEDLAKEMFLKSKYYVLKGDEVKPEKKEESKSIKESVKCSKCGAEDITGEYYIQNNKKHIIPICRDCAKKYSLPELEKIQEDVQVKSNDVKAKLLVKAKEWFVENEDEMGTTEGMTEEEIIKNYWDSLDNNEKGDLAEEFDMETYKDDYELFLQLSDRRVLFDIDTNKPGFNESFYWESVDRALVDFEEDNADLLEGEVTYSGRSGRHILITLCYKNFINYFELKNKYELAEKQFIEDINADINEVEESNEMNESKKLVKESVEDNITKDIKDAIEIGKQQALKDKQTKYIHEDADTGFYYVLNTRKGEPSYNLRGIVKYNNGNATYSEVEVDVKNVSHNLNAEDDKDIKPVYYKKDNGKVKQYLSMRESKLTEEPSEEERFRYSLLDRLRMDCDYFLGNGNGYEGHLWAHSVEDQITKMKELWNSFAEGEKPEWLSMEDIENYEKEMKAKKANKTTEAKVTKSEDEKLNIKGLPSSAKNIADTFTYYKAYEANFKPLIIVKSDKDYLIFKQDAKNYNEYIDYSNSKDYIEGWLHGAVKAKNKVVENKTKFSEAKDKVASTIGKFIYNLTNDKDTEKYGEGAWSANEPTQNGKGITVYEVYKNGRSTFTLDDIKEAVLNKYKELAVYGEGRNSVWFYKPEKQEENLSKKNIKNA